MVELRDLEDEPVEIILGDGKPYKVLHTMRTFLLTEKKIAEVGAGKPIGTYMAEVVALWAGLQAYHAEEFKTLDAVLDVYPTGRIMEVMKAVGESVVKALGTTAKKVEEGPSPLIGPSSTTSASDS